MKKQRLLLAALIFSISSWASASVPIIKLHDSRRAGANFSLPLALNSNFFGIRDNNDLRTIPVPHTGFDVLSDVLKNTESASVLTGQQVSQGSFSSYASEAFTSSSPIAPVSDVGPRRTERGYGSMIALPSAPKIWAVLLLVLGCVVYQGRRRQRPVILK